MPEVLRLIQQNRTRNYKSFALLIDPDNCTRADLDHIVNLARMGGVNFLFVGGSLIVGDELQEVVRYLKQKIDLPLVLFPGSNHHIVAEADAILLLSLISGRNPDFLIGQHVVAAPLLKRSGIEVMPTGYILVDGGAPTTVSYVSNTHPIPSDKPTVAAVTALAGEMLGLKLIYLDAGSGARKAVQPRMIAAVRKETTVPLIVGGGIRSTGEAYDAWGAGADILVVGNAAEKDPDFILEMAAANKEINSL